MFERLMLHDFRCFAGHHELALSERSHLTALLGENGAGKSTVLTAVAILAGALPPSLVTDSAVLEMLANGHRLRIDSTGCFVDGKLYTLVEYAALVKPHIGCQYVPLDGTWREILCNRATLMEYLLEQFDMQYGLQALVSIAAEIADVDKRLAAAHAKQKRSQQYARKFKTSQKFWEKMGHIRENKRRLETERDALAREIAVAQTKAAHIQARVWHDEQAELDNTRESLETDLQHTEAELNALDVELTQAESRVSACTTNIYRLAFDLQCAQVSAQLGEDQYEWQVMHRDLAQSRVNFLKRLSQLAHYDESILTSSSSSSTSSLPEFSRTSETPPVLMNAIRLIHNHKHELAGRASVVSSKLRGLIADEDATMLGSNSVALLQCEARLATDDALQRCTMIEEALAKDTLVYPQLDKQLQSGSDLAGFETSIRLQFPKVLGTLTEFLVPRRGTEIPEAQISHLIEVALHKNEHLHGTQSCPFVVETEDDAIACARHAPGAAFIAFYIDEEPLVHESQLAAELLETHPNTKLLSEFVNAADAGTHRLVSYALGNFVISTAAAARDIVGHPRLQAGMLVMDYTGTVYDKQDGITTVETGETASEQAARQQRLITALQEAKEDLSMNRASQHEQDARLDALDKAGREYAAARARFSELQNSISEHIAALENRERELAYWLGPSRVISDIELLVERVAKESLEELRNEVIYLSHAAHRLENMPSDIPCNVGDNERALAAQWNDMINLAEDTQKLEIQRFDLGVAAKMVQVQIEANQCQRSTLDRYIDGIAPILAQHDEISWDPHPAADTQRLKKRLFEVEHELKKYDGTQFLLDHTDPPPPSEQPAPYDAELAMQITQLSEQRERLSSDQRVLERTKFDRVKLILEELTPSVQEAFSTLSQGPADIMLDFNECGDGKGVMLHAIPQGKPFCPVQQLSAGEFALALLALHFGVAQTRKTPLLLLDEVDAHLDTENSAGVRQLLGSFAFVTGSSTTVLLASQHRQIYELGDQFLALYQLGSVPHAFVHAID